MMSILSVQWDVYLCRTSDLGRIAQLNSAHDKQLQLMLNQGGTGNFWLHLEDEKSYNVEVHKTSTIWYRNGKAKWSGEVFEEEDNVSEGEARKKITVLGWFELLNKRILHTGYEWYEMIIKARGLEITRFPSSEHEKELELIKNQYESILSEGFYTPIATESSQQIYYNNVPMAEIINDLIIRANIDVPTGITIGETAPTNSINLTLQQFQNIGEEITKITALESGPDFDIDPLTRKFSTYRNKFYEDNEGLAGLGTDRGPGVRFTYPGNCVMANRKKAGTKTQNRTEAVGEYSIGKAESISSIQENGLFEVQDSLPEVVNLSILNAYAAVETDTLEQPFTMITFSPKAVGPTDMLTSAVPKPFEDYEIGDVVYCVIKKGSFVVGLEKVPQAVRVYGFNLSIEDSGVENITGLQTNYSSIQ